MKSSLVATISGLLVGSVLLAIAASALIVSVDNETLSAANSQIRGGAPADTVAAPAPVRIDEIVSKATERRALPEIVAVKEVASSRPKATKYATPVPVRATAAKFASTSRAAATRTVKASNRRPERTSRKSRAHAKLAIPPLPIPKYLIPFSDPAFGTKIVRVSNPGGLVPGLGVVWGKAARHHYSLNQAWNADMSLLMLTKGTRGALFLDGQNYKPLFRRVSPGEKPRWHPRRPNILIYVRYNTVALWDVRTDKHEIIAKFPRYSGFRFGPGKGSPSNDGKMIAILARAPDKRLVAFAYDLETGRKYSDIDVSGHKRVSYVTISPLGKYVVVHGTLTGSVSRKGDATRIYDLQGREIGPMWRQYGRPSHFDLTVDDNGDEVAVGVSKSGPEKRHIIKRRLSDGAITVLTGPGYASHTSTRNIRKPGWAFVSYSVDKFKRNRDPYHSEIVAVRLDGSMDIRRIAQTRSVGYDQYLAEPHGSPSPDGSRVIWASNWGTRRGPIAAYVATLPAGALLP